MATIENTKKFLALSLICFSIVSLGHVNPSRADYENSQGGAIVMKTQILTTDIVASSRFYIDILNMEIVDQWDDPDDKGMILKPAGGDMSGQLELYASDQQHRFEGMSIQFKVADISVFAAGLPDTIEYSGPTLRPWGSTYVYLTDPNGVQIIVYQEQE